MHKATRRSFAWLILLLPLLFVGKTAAAGSIPSATPLREYAIIAGNVQMVAVDGPLVYFNDDREIVILNAATPASPQELGRIQLAAFPLQIALDGNHAFVTTTLGMTVLDISDPTNPFKIGAFDSTQRHTAITIDGDRAYVGYEQSGSPIGPILYGPTGIRIFDISNPGAPVAIGSAEGPRSSGCLTSGGPCGISYARYRDIAIDGDFVHMTASNIVGTPLDGEPGLWTVDISDDTNPQTYAHTQLNETAHSLTTANGTLYVTSEETRINPGGTPLLDLSHLRIFDPQANGDLTELVDFIDCPTGPTCTPGDSINMLDIEVRDSTAWVMSREGLRLYDVQNPATPTLIDTVFDYPTGFRSMAVSNGFVFLANTARGLAILGPDTSGTGGEPCETPGLTAETWQSIPGGQITDLTSSPFYPLNPTTTAILDSFDLPLHTAESYGTRVRGYIIAPQSGAYTFSIAGDDQAELWLSSNDSIVGVERIAHVPAWTGYQEFDKYEGQVSAEINLTAGNRYYIEALFKEDFGGDHLTVIWERPDETTEIIGGDALCQFEIEPLPLNSGFTTTPDPVIAPGIVTIDARYSTGNIDEYEYYIAQTTSGTPPTVPDVTIITDSPIITHEFTEPGYYAITVVVWSGEERDVSVQFVDVIESVNECETRGLSRELWFNIHGTELWRLTSDPRFPNSPDSRDIIPNFEHNIDSREQYGTRLTGYVQPPETGWYTFYLASDDQGRFSISDGSDPSGLSEVATVSTWVPPHVYDWYAEQQSEPIYLESDRRYYVEALQKEFFGGDHLSIAWSLNGASPTIIPSSSLCPSELIAGLPQAEIQVIGGGVAPQTVTFDGGNSTDPNGTIVNYEWRFSDGSLRFGETVSMAYSDPGTYGVELIVTDNEGNTGRAETTVEIGDSVASCANESLLRETWFEVPGSKLQTLFDDPRYPNSPDTVEGIGGDVFGRINFAEDFGTKLSGYLIPTVTDTYTFWLSSDDEGQLLLSTDDNPANAVDIAAVPDWVPFDTWTWYSDQRSEPIELTAGQRYYIEVRHKEGFGNDHAVVAWERPSTTRTPIASQYLCPPEDAPTTKPSVWTPTPSRNLTAATVAESQIARAFPVLLYDDAVAVMIADGELRSRLFALQQYADDLLAVNGVISAEFVAEAEFVVNRFAALGSAELATWLLNNWNAANFTTFTDQPALTAWNTLNTTTPTQITLSTANTHTATIHILILILFTSLALTTRHILTQNP